MAQAAAVGRHLRLISVQSRHRRRAGQKRSSVPVSYTHLVYFTIDLDCLDPSIFPGTGTPEAGGVSFTGLLDAIRTVCTARVVAADVNELAPLLDASGVSTATACKVLRELILALHGCK